MRGLGRTRSSVPWFACARRPDTPPSAVASGFIAAEERRLPEGTLDPDFLAVLAEALEEAGCTDPAVLDHLRGPGPHVRGCWPVELILGKGQVTGSQVSLRGEHWGPKDYLQCK